MSKPVIVVFGATGSQGGSVARTLVKTGQWNVRGVTRNLDSNKARALRAEGVDVVQGDLSSRADLLRILDGAYGVFLVTDFYSAGAAQELTQGKLAIDAAKEKNVQQFVFSSLENAEKISGGKRKVPHFTSKAKIEKYLKKSGLNYSLIQASFYYENFFNFPLVAPKHGADGVLEFSLPLRPDALFPLNSVEDTGAIVAPLFQDKDKYAGKKIAIVGEYLTPEQISKEFSKVWNQAVRFKQVSEEDFAQLNATYAGEWADMFKWFEEFGYYGEKIQSRDILNETKLVGAPKLRSFASVLAEHHKKGCAAAKASQ